MVITVTLNPLVDKTVYVYKLIPGNNHWVKTGPEVVGGKGINVSRIVKRFGGETIALTFIGGETGTYLSTLLNQEGIKSRLIRTKSPTRIQVSLLDVTNNKPSFFIFPNEGVTQEELETLKFELSNLLANRGKKTILVVSGSAPTGNMDGSIKEIISIANKFNIITILDSYGTAFKTALSEKPFCIKQNRKEAESYFRFSLSKQDKILDAIERFHKNDVRLVILTSGKEWVYAGFNGYIWKLTPPKVKTVNPTGSGDSMTGSIALDLLSSNHYCPTVEVRKT